MAMKRVELELTRARVMDTQAFVDGRLVRNYGALILASVQLEGNLKPTRVITVWRGMQSNRRVTKMQMDQSSVRNVQC